VVSNLIWECVTITTTTGKHGGGEHELFSEPVKRAWGGEITNTSLPTVSTNTIDRPTNTHAHTHGDPSIGRSGIYVFPARMKRIVCRRRDEVYAPGIMGWKFEISSSYILELPLNVFLGNLEMTGLVRLLPARVSSTSEKFREASTATGWTRQGYQMVAYGIGRLKASLATQPHRLCERRQWYRQHNKK